MLTVNKREGRGATKKLRSNICSDSDWLALAYLAPPAMALEPFAGCICPLLLGKYSAATPQQPGTYTTLQPLLRNGVVLTYQVGTNILR